MTGSSGFRQSVGPPFLHGLHRMIERMVDLTKHHCPLRKFITAHLEKEHSQLQFDSCPWLTVAPFERVTWRSQAEWQSIAVLFSYETSPVFDRWQMDLCHQKHVPAVFIDLVRSLLCRGTASGCQFASRRRLPIPAKEKS